MLSGIFYSTQESRKKNLMMRLHMSTVPAVESECACLNCPALFEGWSWTVARPAELAKQLDNWWAGAKEVLEPPPVFALSSAQLLSK